MDASPYFYAVPFVTMRLATLPRSYARITATDLALDASGDQELSSYVRKVAADPVVREAIDVSSGSMSALLDKIDQGDPVGGAKLRRAALAVTRYVLRMSGRPTPFGLHAGVCLAELGDSAEFRMGSDHEKSVEPDSEWVRAVQDELHRIEVVRGQVSVVANNLCVLRGDRLVLPYVRRTGKGASRSRPDRELTVAATPAVRAAMDVAYRPTPYSELRRQLVQSFTVADESVVDRMLTTLIDREFLLSDLRDHADNRDALGTLVSRLESLEGLDVTGIRSVWRLMHGYAGRRPGEGREEWRRLTNRMSDLYSTGSAPPAQVDLRMDAEVSLPESVTEDVARAADVLWKLAPPSGSLPNLNGYHQRFLEKYGTERTVGLLELLDPHTGMGPPDGYRVPRADRDITMPAESYPAERDDALAWALFDHDVEDELVLDEDLIGKLSQEDETPPPESLDLCVQVLAASTEDLARGHYELVVSGGAGSIAAGAMAGRFTGLLDSADLLATTTWRSVGADGPARAAPVAAQLRFAPLEPRFDNVTRMPRVLPHELSIGSFADPEDEHVIDVRDLVVGSDGNQLCLTVPGWDRAVSARHMSMLNLTSAAPNVARFAAAVGMMGRRPWTPWDWGRLNSLPELPRVRFGRTLLAPARWKPAPALGDDTMAEDDWTSRLDEWRRRFHVPDLVRASTADSHVDLDLTSRVHRRVLRTFVRRGGAVVQEVPDACGGGFQWSAGRSNEVVVPLVSSHTPQPKGRPHAARSSVSERVGHPPGGEWIFCKIYVHRDAQNSFLVNELARFVDETDDLVDRWFFVRYADPHDHLRIRLHGDPGTLHTQVLPELHDWTRRAVSMGLISTMSLDTYVPEMERYGGPRALEAAEDVFSEDSSSVLRQLASHLAGRPAAPLEALAAADYAHVLSALGDWNWQKWFVAAYPDSLQHKVPAVDMRAARSFVDSAVATVENNVPAGSASSDNVGTRAAVARYGRLLGVSDATHEPLSSIIASILHMHANRLLGVDSEAEHRSYGILRSVLRSRLARTRTAP